MFNVFVHPSVSHSSFSTFHQQKKKMITSFLIVANYVVLFSWQIRFVVFADQLKFDRSDETVSVVVGKRALLPCYVSIEEAKATNNGQGPFKVIDWRLMMRNMMMMRSCLSFSFFSKKVIWMKLNNSSILTMEDRAINGDPRISLLHAYADEWNLQIDDIDEDDAGIYRCVINTGMYKTVTLDVKGNSIKIKSIWSTVWVCLVPPKIIDELTSEPYPSPIRSGSNFTLKCYAHGKPMPKIRILSYDHSENAKSTFRFLRCVCVRITLSNWTVKRTFISFYFRLEERTFVDECRIKRG